METMSVTLNPLLCVVNVFIVYNLAPVRMTFRNQVRSSLFQLAECRPGSVTKGIDLYSKGFTL